MTGMLVQKSFTVKAMPPLDGSQAVAAINKIAPEPVAAADLYIGRARLANDQLDRAHEKFPVSYLERFAETLPGKAVLPGHDKSKLPIGRWFGASLARDETGVTHLVADYYLPAGSETATLVKMGIAKDVSIGFLAAGRTCDLCGGAYEKCDHVAGHVYDGKTATITYSGDTSRVEAMEGSFVWVGAQYGAQAIGAKSGADGGGIVVKMGETGMETKELEERIKALETENTALKESAAKAAALEARAKDGEQYLTDLKAEISRKLGVLEEEPGPELKLLENANLETLKAWDERLGKRIDVKFPPTGVSKMLGVPNGAAPPPDMPQGFTPPATFDPRRSLRGE